MKMVLAPFWAFFWEPFWEPGLSWENYPEMGPTEGWPQWMPVWVSSGGLNGKPWLFKNWREPCEGPSPEVWLQQAPKLQLQAPSLSPRLSPPHQHLSRGLQRRRRLTSRASMSARLTSLEFPVDRWLWLLTAKKLKQQ